MKKKGFTLSIIYFSLVLVVCSFIFTCSVFQGAKSFLNHDNVSLGYPLRVLVSTAYSNKIVPLWNHWARGGTPLSTLYTALPESPVVRFVSLFGVYNETSFTIEVLIYFLLGFFGTYLWLRSYGSLLVALFGASAYCLCGYMIIQAPINVEGIIGPLMYPWCLLGLRLSLLGNPMGVVYSAFSFWIMFTTGYLGTNVIAIQFISLFCFGEWCLGFKHRKQPVLGQLLKALSYLSLGALVTCFLLSFSLFETYHYFKFDFSQLRPERFDPYEGSAQLASLSTLIYPNFVSVFVRGSYGGYMAMMFCGLLVLFFAIFSLFNKNEHPLKIWVITFICLTTAAILSPKYPIGVFFSNIIPFYIKIRFHGWNVIIAVLFIILLSVLGLKDFLNEYYMNKKLLFSILLVFFSVYLAHKSLHLNSFMTYPQVYIFLLFLILLPWLSKSRKRNPELVCLAIIALLLGEFFALKSDYVHLNQNRPYLAAIESVKKLNFVSPNNIRKDKATDNEQYFSKEVFIEGYNPLVLPEIKTIFDEKRTKKYLKWIFYPNNGYKNDIEASSKVKFREFTSSNIQAIIQNDSKSTEDFVWSSPFTENWKLKINHAPAQLIRTPVGLSGFRLEPGPSLIELEYSPNYLFLCSILKLFGMLIMFTIVWITYFPKRKGGDPALSH